MRKVLIQMLIDEEEMHHEIGLFLLINPEDLTLLI